MKAILASIPHSGEQVGEEADWLRGLPEEILMCDVDRFVDRLYQEILKQHQIPTIVTPYHRYMVDCNRWPSDVDANSLEGSQNPVGTHPIGLHWIQTTKGDILIKKPLSLSLHKTLIKKYYNQFFEKIDSIYEDFKKRGVKKTYHLDLHSMPSLGKSVHRDPDQQRPDIVIATLKGKSATPEWTQQVESAFFEQDFTVVCNNPYIGGSIVEKYGNPEKGHQILMIELNRKLYMNEQTKAFIPEKAEKVKQRLSKVISRIYKGIPNEGN